MYPSLPRVQKKEAVWRGWAETARQATEWCKCWPQAQYTKEQDFSSLQGQLIKDGRPNMLLRWRYVVEGLAKHHLWTQATYISLHRHRQTMKQSQRHMVNFTVFAFIYERQNAAFTTSVKKPVPTVGPLVSTSWTHGIWNPLSSARRPTVFDIRGFHLAVCVNSSNTSIADSVHCRPTTTSWSYTLIYYLITSSVCHWHNSHEQSFRQEQKLVR